MDPQTEEAAVDPELRREYAGRGLERKDKARAWFTWFSVAWVGFSLLAVIGIVLYFFLVLLGFKREIPQGVDRLILAVLGVQTIGGLLL